MSYSVDLRERVVGALGEGMKKTEIVRVFKLGYRTVQRYEKLADGGVWNLGFLRVAHTKLERKKRLP
ncbi:MAG: hypothetical protein C4332_12635 [Meiothermus sp.]